MESRFEKNLVRDIADCDKRPAILRKSEVNAWDHAYPDDDIGSQPSLQSGRSARGTLAYRPELPNWPFYTHKRTKCERQAALVRVSGIGRSGLIPSLFSDIPFVVPQT